MADVGNYIIPEARSKNESIASIAAGQLIVALATDDAVATVSSKDEIIAAVSSRVSPPLPPVMIPLPLPPVKEFGSHDLSPNCPK